MFLLLKRQSGIQILSKLTTSEGLEVTYDLSKLTVDAMWQEVYGEITVNVTIPANYDNDEIVIAPEVFEQISNKIYEKFKNMELNKV